MFKARKWAGLALRFPWRRAAARRFTLITDFRPDGLDVAEVWNVIDVHLSGNWRTNHVAIHPLSTIETGFVLYQLALARERAPVLCYLVNCAPRADSDQPRPHNEGEPLLFFELKDPYPNEAAGRTPVRGAAVNSGHSLSFVRENIAALYALRIAPEKLRSQFRTRDAFAEVAAKIAMGRERALLGEELDPMTAIPAPPGVPTFVSRDGFGLMKCFGFNGCLSRLAPGSEVDLTFEPGGETVRAVYAPGTFGVSPGQFSIAPGSSGHREQVLEIGLRGGDAWEKIGRPRLGASIKVVGA